MKTTVMIILLSLLSMPALSASIKDLDEGDKAYIQGITSDDLVTIVRIDYSNRKVKVRREDGTIDWVDANKIITHSESVNNDMGRGAVITIGVVCLFNPDACKSKD